MPGIGGGQGTSVGAHEKFTYNEPYDVISIGGMGIFPQGEPGTEGATSYGGPMSYPMIEFLAAKSQSASYNMTFTQASQWEARFNANPNQALTSVGYPNNPYTPAAGSTNGLGFPGYVAPLASQPVPVYIVNA